MGRTTNKYSEDILAYLNHELSSGPVEAINGRLEHLRGTALGFQSLVHYI
ncbi:transposase [Corynebacterium choanae]